MFHEIRDNWFLLACVALFFVAWGISAWIKKMFRWDDFKKSVLRYVRDESSVVLGDDIHGIENFSLEELSKCVNFLGYPVRDKIIETGGWTSSEFGRHCMRVYARRYNIEALMDRYLLLRKEADDEYSQIDLP